MFGAVWTSTERFKVALLFFTAGMAFVNAPHVVANIDFAVPEGFTASVAAEDSLVHDAFSMTLNSSGQPVVSGPGYIRTLIDDNQDGVFDRYVTWANLPAQGAQGLWAEERSVYWVGDKGLWRSEDLDGDLVGDGIPKQVLALPTGGEHDAHAIRRGPDGYWYLIVGNYAADIQKINNDRDAPVKKPRAGTIWRISPDFSQRGAWAHGFRNAYDFDFLANGQMVTYDSDEEREISLPWYRPTRVSVISPGVDAGWVDSTWFDIEQRVTMPQVISKLGRGSPTGVAVYHHRVFPKKYHEAVFVLDWTFGRVIAIYPQPIDVNDASAKPNRFMAETFMQATGTVGFAPTDLCVEPDGSMLFCVGGRGTSGALYRVRYSGTSVGGVEATIKPTNEDVSSSFGPSQLTAITSILSQPCPWESWSSSIWKKLLIDVASPQALEAVFDGRLQIESSDPLLAGQWRRRAAQMLAFSKHVPNIDSLKKALQSNCSVTSSAAWWMLGRTDIKISNQTGESLVDEFLQSSATDASQASESAWDQLLGGLVWRQRHESMGLKHWSVALAPVPPSSDWQQRNGFRQIQLWAMSRNVNSAFRQISSSGTNQESLDSLMAKCLYSSGIATVDAKLMDRLAIRASKNEIGKSSQEILEAITILQVALGDFRHSIPLQQSPPQIHATDGYKALYIRKVPEKVREGWARWCLSLVDSNIPSERVVIETEILRTLAMLEPESVAVVDYCLSTINDDSHPTSDLHALVVLSCCKAIRSQTQTAATATSLLALLEKVRSLGLNIDNSWNNRLEQIFKQLVQRDASLPNYLSSNQNDIDSNSVFWLTWCPAKTQESARSRINNQLANVPVANWSDDLVRFACTESVDIRLATKLRAESASPPSALTLELLSKLPSQQDYSLMIASLANGTRDLWPLAWKGLSRMTTEKPSDEFQALALLFAKLKNAPMTEISMTNLVNRLRSNAVKLKLNDVPLKESWDEWNVFFAENLDDASLEKLKAINGPPANWDAVVKESSGFSGDASHGQALFLRAKCSQCHGGGNALGPSLAGITRRFSNEDLFRAIFEPSRDISDRYRSIKILTTNGETLVGMLVYESTDGVTLQAADGKLLRINQADIDDKSNSTVSIMPNGLLDGVGPSDLADLTAYLKKL